MQIEKASLKDEPWIRQLLTVSGLPHQDITPAHLENFWVVKEKGGILGVAGLEVYGRIGLLRSLAVDPRHQRRGWGSQLEKRAEEYAGSLKLGVLYLLTMTAESFFQNRGFEKIERESAPPEIKKTAEYQGLCPTTSVLMRKVLSRRAA